ncbi:MAG: type II toxin-antitoxin system PemK/MazF family toxin [Candidatus Solibacter sp.]|nr:type II toxin-antitoxin system PemK/MazF family toxin [Candidatus Solibacter sp.]
MRQRVRKARHNAISAYAAEMAGTDLDLESAGIEPGRTRPVIQIPDDGFNQTPGWRSIIVVPISTSATQGKRGPTVIPLPGGVAGLPKSSFAVWHQATTLDLAKLTRRIGVLPSEFMREVDGGLKAAMDLD